MFSLNRIHWPTVIVTFVIFAACLVVLHFMGRIPWCTCGIGLFTPNAWSPDTSQHFADPYSTSHLLHGIIFYLALRYIAPNMPMRHRFVIALLLEVGWEILENSPIIIDRYRANTASLDYTGDSILNSSGDIVFALLGFWLAYKLPWKWTLAIVIAIELLMLAMFRDNLTLNVIMLIVPLDWLIEWQKGH